MRPDLQLFLHVFGAIALFGAMATIAILGFATRRYAAQQAQLASATLGTVLLVALPSWLVMFVFGSWTKSNEHLPGTIQWLEVGSTVAGVGAVVILASAGLTYAWVRRPADLRLPILVAVIATAYLAALGLAWWVMTAKVSL